MVSGPLFFVRDKEDMELLPLFLKLAGRAVLLVGNEEVLAPKRAALERAGAEVRYRNEAAFTGADLEGVWLVVAAASALVNARIAHLAEARQIFVNAVDDPPNASAYLGGVVRRDGVTVAISTSGDAPALAGLLREGLDALLPTDLDRWTAAARDARAAWKAGGVPMAERRPLLLEALNAIYGGADVSASATGDKR
jgi:uroporphyrin-III C-methyltransferase/precorrin-2 dehydrogenase/sirohydrochlorin ferrochelatase